MYKNKFKLAVSVFLFAIAIALCGCVSEEGARKHAERAHATAAASGVVPGMMWEAVVYRSDDSEDRELGRFESRDECHRAAQAHITQHEQAEGEQFASACVITKADS